MTSDRRTIPDYVPKNFTTLIISTPCYPSGHIEFEEKNQSLNVNIRHVLSQESIDKIMKIAMQDLRDSQTSKSAQLFLTNPKGATT